MKDMAKWTGIGVVILLAAFGGIFMIGQLAAKTEVALGSSPDESKPAIEARVAVAETDIETAQDDIVEIKAAQIRYTDEHRADMKSIEGRFDDMQTEQTKILSGVETLVQRGNDGGGSP